MSMDALLSSSLPLIVVEPLATGVMLMNMRLRAADSEKQPQQQADGVMKPELVLPPLLVKAANPNLPSFQSALCAGLDGATMRKTYPRYRNDSLQTARTHVEKWGVTNKELMDQIQAKLPELSAEEKAELIPPSFFTEVVGLTGKRLALFLQLVLLSMTRKAVLTFSSSSPTLGYYGITEVHVAVDAIKAFDAMPIPTQSTLRKTRKLRTVQSFTKLWREAAFKESVTLDGGLLMTHVRYVPTALKQLALLTSLEQKQQKQQQKKKNPK